MNRPLSEGERKAFTDILVTLISERVAAIGDLSEQLADVRKEHATLKLLYVWVTGTTALYTMEADSEKGHDHE